MSILKDHVVICLDAISSENMRNTIIEEITRSDLNPAGTHEILEISHFEASNMCANMFDVIN